LVIGNGAYNTALHLPNPRNDAEDVAVALTRIGFETILGLDVDKAAMDELAIQFARRARDADIAIFYFSGHALQLADINFLMPIDAKLTDEADLRRATRVDDIVAELQQAKNLKVLGLDACRDNPLAEGLRRSFGVTLTANLQHGLARIDSPQGMIVAYATQAGRTQHHFSPHRVGCLRSNQPRTNPRAVPVTDRGILSAWQASRRKRVGRRVPRCTLRHLCRC
jgi:uncharacterized caspase-like protein